MKYFLSLLILVILTSNDIIAQKLLFGLDMQAVKDQHVATTKWHQSTWGEYDNAKIIMFVEGDLATYYYFNTDNIVVMVACAPFTNAALDKKIEEYNKKYIIIERDKRWSTKVNRDHILCELINLEGDLIFRWLINK